MSAALACILGWPVNASLSPAMHNAAFGAVGLDWTYVPLAVRPGAIADGIELVRSLGIAGGNVTMPHKEAIVPFMDALEGPAERLGAVNTFVRVDGGLVGHNTDGAGFLRALREDARVDPAGRRAVVLGAGGAARAVVVALAEAGAAVGVMARRRDRASEVAALAGCDVLSWGDPVEADIVVNATPAREGLPLASLGFATGVVAVDLIYPPPETPFVAAARAAGAAAHDGLGMLLYQAAASFEIWTGVQAPVEVMRAAAAEALAALPETSGPQP